MRRSVSIVWGGLCPQQMQSPSSLGGCSCLVVLGKLRHRATCPALLSPQLSWGKGSRWGTRDYYYGASWIRQEECPLLKGAAFLSLITLT